MGIAEPSVIYRHILCLPFSPLCIITYPWGLQFLNYVAAPTKKLAAEEKVGCRKNPHEVRQVSWCFRQEQLGKGTASSSAVLLSNPEPFRTLGFPLG